jgi:hypothetical protein
VRGLCAESGLPSEDGFEDYRRLIAKFERQALAKRGQPGPEVDSFTARFRDTEADLFNTKWLRYSGRTCKHKPPPVPLVPVTFAIAESSSDFHKLKSAGRIGDADQVQVLSALDFALDHGRIASIGIDLNTVLAEPDEEDGDHAVSVAGRRHVMGACEYLIRDSSGVTCREYESQMRKRCKNRQVWLTETELKRSIYGVTYLR